MRVYLNEFNIRMEKSAYLPIATGMLRATAEARPLIKSAYEFQPFFYHVDEPQTILARYRNPQVAAFSTWMWNEQLCLTVAKEVKERWPECLIVFGGLQVPHDARAYLAQHPFIDLAVRAEGEDAFSEVLERNLDRRDFSGLPNVTWRCGEFNIKNLEEHKQQKDLDYFPSPYLDGLFEDIMGDGKFEMQATVEVDRGCPFPCSFCAWGNNGLSRKIRYHGIERMRLEIEWAAKHKVRYLFNASANFGMQKRDEEIAQILVDTKTKYGFPEKFRTCFGKNADDRIYGIAKKLHDADMEKGITLAIQSNTPEVLKNIRRQNISMETYQYLQRKFNEAKVPVYSELILGMPGETYESWKAGIEKLLAAGLQNQLFIYLCQILPNTQMADPTYQKEHGLVIQRVDLGESHGAIRSDTLVTEYEDIIVANATMPPQHWRRALLLSWMTMTMHSLKLAFFVMLWLNRRFGVAYTDFLEALCNADEHFPILRSRLNDFDTQVNRLVSGKGRGREVPGYGALYWDEEEAAFLRITENLDDFYVEMRDITRQFLHERGLAYTYQELIEVMQYQRARIPTFNDTGKPPHHGDRRVQLFSYNLPEFFERALIEDINVVQDPQTLTVHYRPFADKPQYAREAILWGRKSGKIMNVVEWTTVRTL